MNTALNRTVTTILTNKSGQNLLLGDVVVINTANASAITVTAIADYITTFPGVVIEPNGIANNDTGLVAFLGYVDKINLTTVAAVGDKISTSTTIQKGLPSANNSQGTFAIALEASITPKAILVGLYGNSGGATVNPSQMEAVLTLSTGTGIATDVIDIYTGTTIYLMPYNGNKIALYNTGTLAWEALTVNNTIVTPLTGLSTGTNYDIFIYATGSAGVIQFVAWTNDTTRATDLVQQDNIFVHPTHRNKRYIGTFRNTNNSTDDAPLKRLLWNMYNRRSKKLVLYSADETWTINSASAYQPVNGNTNYRFHTIIGIAEDLIDIDSVLAGQGVGAQFLTGIGVNSVSATGCDLYSIEYGVNTFATPSIAKYRNIPAIGYTYYQWLQNSGSSVTGLGRASAIAFIRSGMSGVIKA